MSDKNISDELSEDSHDDGTITASTSNDDQAELHQVSETEGTSPIFPSPAQYSELLSSHKTDELMRKQMKYIIEGPPEKKMKPCDETAPSIDVNEFKVASKEWVEESIERVLKYYRTTEDELLGRVLTPEDRAFFRESQEQWGNSMKTLAEYLAIMKAYVAKGEEYIKIAEKIEALLDLGSMNLPPENEAELKQVSEGFQDLKRQLIDLANENRGTLEEFLKYKLYPRSKV